MEPAAAATRSKKKPRFPGPCAGMTAAPSPTAPTSCGPGRPDPLEPVAPKEVGAARSVYCWTRGLDARTASLHDAAARPAEVHLVPDQGASGLADPLGRPRRQALRRRV